MENDELIKLIDDGLHRYIADETQNHQIFNEADLQACTYDYVKRIVRSDDCWPDWSGMLPV
jgi:hypothetical protein